jgi:putative ABC transport system permease protein
MNASNKASSPSEDRMDGKRQPFRRVISTCRFILLNTSESVSIALSSLWSSRLRSLLTLLGVIIGVTTVITVVSIIEGMNQARRRKRITIDQMISLRENCTLCQEVGASVNQPSRVKYGRHSIDDVELIGTTSNIVEIGDYRIEEGRMFTESDEIHRRPVCIIGNEVRAVLFPDRDPINREIRVGNHRYTVIGTNEKRGTFLGENLDNFILIPISLYQKIYGASNTIDVHVKARDREALETTKDQARFLFRAIRDVERDADDDFGIVSTNALIETYRDFTGMAYLVMIGVASISLLIGGIVIMNIMLVSVTERIKEIGIRKAVGAKKLDIVGQFLAESATIAVVGGILGILLGAGISQIVSKLSPLPASVELWAVIAGIVVSGGIGICFGLFPALRAARMNPITALRQE